MPFSAFTTKLAVEVSTTSTAIWFHSLLCLGTVFVPEWSFVRRPLIPFIGLLYGALREMLQELAEFLRVFRAINQDLSFSPPSLVRAGQG